MLYRSVIITLLLAYAEARFGQEGLVQDIISGVQGGEAGAAATLAGATISDLLGGANACDKLASADQIVAELGGGADAIEAAIALVAAEKNTNPDANGNAQNVCADPALPATEELRGITPLIDPAVDVDGAVNALSAQTVGAPLDATGKSVFDLIVEAGLGDFVVGQDSAGGVVNAGAGAGADADDAADDAAADVADDAANDVADDAANDVADNVADDAADVVDDQVDCEDVVDDAADDVVDDAADEEVVDNNVDAGNDNAGAGQQSTIAGLDFGLCVPTVKFEGGLGGRPADEFTFQMIDPLAAQGQQEALNPAIIFNRLCDQLGNVCEANDAAIAACEAAQVDVVALGTRDKSTADAWNTALGFDGAITNPSGGPAEPPAAKRAIKFRA